MDSAAADVTLIGSVTWGSRGASTSRYRLSFGIRPAYLDSFPSQALPKLIDRKLFGFLVLIQILP